MAPSHLYLDTARLGRMTPAAQQALTEFARLAGEEGGSWGVDQFLRSGFDPGDRTGSQYPLLASWKGVTALKASLRVLAGHRPDLPVLLANRSAQLMKVAARLLFHPCRNVLVTDLGWPEYHAILEAEAKRASRAVSSVPLRERMLEGAASEDEVVDLVRGEFVRRECDGLFLSAVSNTGVLLPVEGIVRAVESVTRVRFVVVDGAQSFCHASAGLRTEYADLYLAGCHKWLGAYHPMGLAFFGKNRSRMVIETILGVLLETGELDDPLLRFSAELEGAAHRPVSETVSTTALFACHGAVADAIAAGQDPACRLPGRIQNAELAAHTIKGCGWKPVLPPPTARTGILLLQAEREVTQNLPAEAVRAAFHDRGIALTAYNGGLIRLSMPERRWGTGELEQLRDACRAAA